MKKTLFLILTLILVATVCATAQSDEGAPAERETRLMTIEAHDGYPIEGKLDLPAGENVRRVVVFVNGSGPNTYDNRRQSGEYDFNYYDLFAEHLTNAGVAFFRYNTRGCAPGAEPPLFVEIDEAAYQTYTPQNSVQDVESIVNALKGEARLQNAQVYLLGWSEGTMAAPQVAQRGNAPVDMLLLCGYVNGTMEEALDWQQSGGASMVFYRQYFDADGDGAISRAEFDADPNGIKAYLGAAFEDVDLDADGVLTEEDFKIMLSESRSEIFNAIEQKDDAWLKENYPVRLTSAWFWGHREFAPNREVMPTLDLPIQIFQGEVDQNTSVQQALDIQAEFERLGKTNLTVHTFPAHDHDLNYSQYLVNGTLSEGFEALFAACEAQ